MSEEETLEPGSSMFFLYVGLCFVLVLFAGLASGLTVGLLSLDQLTLTVLKSTGTPVEQKQATRLQRITKNHHLLLVTLLLWNAAAMETLPLFLDKLVPAYLAIILSVTLVLIFGEVLPQALFTGPNKFRLGAMMVPVVLVLQYVIIPISWPISKLLDCVLGHHSEEFFRRHELKALIEYHAKERRGGRELSKDEVTIITGCLDMIEKKAEDVMTKVEDIYMLDIESRLNAEVVTDLLHNNFSRVPVHGEGGRNDIRGLLIVKRLVSISPQDNRSVRSLMLRRPIVVTPDTQLLMLLNEFQKGSSHLALVTHEVDEYRKALRTHDRVPQSAQLLGIVTLEDVIEELIQEEIEDEGDISQLHTLSTVYLAANNFKRLLSKRKRRILLAQRASMAGGADPKEVELAMVENVTHIVASPPTLEKGGDESSSSSAPGAGVAWGED